MNGLVGKGSSAIMTVSTSQSHTQKAMLRERRRRRKKRREYQKGSLVHVLRAHPQLHQSAPGVGPKVGPGDSWLPSHHWVHNMCQIFEDFQYTWMEHSQQHLSEMAAPGECPVELKT